MRTGPPAPGPGAHVGARRDIKSGGTARCSRKSGLGGPQGSLVGNGDFHASPERKIFSEAWALAVPRVPGSSSPAWLEALTLKREVPEGQESRTVC